MAKQVTAWRMSDTSEPMIKAMSPYYDMHFWGQFAATGDFSRIAMADIMIKDELSYGYDSSANLQVSGCVVLKGSCFSEAYNSKRVSLSVCEFI
jgi:hypothetical protein